MLDKIFVKSVRFSGALGLRLFQKSSQFVQKLLKLIEGHLRFPLAVVFSKKNENIFKQGVALSRLMFL